MGGFATFYRAASVHGEPPSSDHAKKSEQAHAKNVKSEFHLAVIIRNGHGCHNCTLKSTKWA